MKTYKSSSVYNHRRDKKTRTYCVYTVYNNRTDMPVIVDGTAKECAKAMNLSESSFYSTVSKRLKKWTIIRKWLDGRNNVSPS